MSSSLVINAGSVVTSTSCRTKIGLFTSSSGAASATTSMGGATVGSSSSSCSTNDGPGDTGALVSSSGAGDAIMTGTSGTTSIGSACCGKVKKGCEGASAAVSSAPEYIAGASFDWCAD